MATEFSNVLAKIESYQAKNDDDKTQVLLRALFQHAPNDDAREMFAREVDGCYDDTKLRDLGQRYFIGLLVRFRAAGGKTPSITLHPSRHSADENANNNAAILQGTPRESVRIKRECFDRDNYRCIFTGAIDDSAPGEIPPGASLVTNVGAHIIPFNLIGGKSTRDQLSIVWSLIDRYGGIALQGLNGPQINGLQNVLTASVDAHDQFGKLHIWLEAIPDRANSYYLRKAHPGYLVGHPDGKEITLRTNTPHALPDPRYLALHAACAKILHMTAMAKVVDKIVEDWEDTPVLSEDGSSANLLTHALALATPRNHWTSTAAVSVH